MERMGYITRSKNERDRRNVDLSLTPQGRDAAIEVKNERARRADRLFAALDQEEKEQLFRTKSKLLSIWETLPSESGEESI